MDETPKFGNGCEEKPSEFSCTCTCIHACTICLIPPSTAQTISPTDLQGQVGDNVVFECTSFLVNDTDNTLVEFRTASETGFSVLDNINNPRLNRSDSGSITTYTYGPLTPEDNNAVFRCQSSSRPTAGATISVVCKCTTMSVHVHVHVYVQNKQCTCMYVHGLHV